MRLILATHTVPAPSPCCLFPTVPQNETDDTKSAHTAPMMGLSRHSLYHSLSRSLHTQLFSSTPSLVLRRLYQHMANSMQPVSPQDNRPPDTDFELNPVSSFGDASQHSCQKSTSPDDCPPKPGFLQTFVLFRSNARYERCDTHSQDYLGLHGVWAVSNK